MQALPDERAWYNARLPLAVIQKRLDAVHLAICVDWRFGERCVPLDVCQVLVRETDAREPANEALSRQRKYTPDLPSTPPYNVVSLSEKRDSGTHLRRRVHRLESAQFGSLPRRNGREQLCCTCRDAPAQHAENPPQIPRGDSPCAHRN